MSRQARRLLADRSHARTYGTASAPLLEQPTLKHNLLIPIVKGFFAKGPNRIAKLKSLVTTIGSYELSDSQFEDLKSALGSKNPKDLSAALFVLESTIDPRAKDISIFHLLDDKDWQKREAVALFLGKSLKRKDIGLLFKHFKTEENNRVKLAIMKSIYKILDKEPGVGLTSEQAEILNKAASDQDISIRTIAWEACKQTGVSPLSEQEMQIRLLEFVATLSARLDAFLDAFPDSDN